MTSVFYAIADIFNALFTVLPYIGRAVNLLFIASGSIACVIWLWHMAKTEQEEKGFNA